jgi:hypothetical protein
MKCMKNRQGSEGKDIQNRSKNLQTIHRVIHRVKTLANMD